jgi:hypothetical protein
MALLAKEVLASQRSSSDTFIQKQQSPQQYVFRSKETGQQIDLTTGDGISKINPNTGTITTKKKKRQSLAVVPPPLSTRI